VTAGGPGDSETDRDLAVGAVFGGFRIEAVIGRGGMGTVYRARDLTLDSERALKVLDPALARDGGFRERFQRESRLAAAIDDPAVVPIYQAGEHDGRLFIAMRLVRGPDLHRLVAADGPLEPQRTARLIGALASALDAAHAQGIVHRDVKPANMLIELGPAGERVFLSDFGISRPPRAATPVTSTGQLLGTADYIAPEQVDGLPAEAASDVYALGCVVCFLLTGEPPFARESELATLYAHGHAERPRPSLLEPGLPAAIDDVVVRATAVDPAQRQASAGELAAELTAALGKPGSAERSVAVAAEPTTRRIEPPRRRRRLAALAAGIGTLALAAVVAFAIAGGDDDAGGGGESPSPAAGTGADPPAISTVTIGEPVDSIVVGEVNVLAGAKDGSSLHAIDPVTEQPARSAETITAPTAVAVGFGSVWVANEAGDEILRFGPPQRGVAEEIAVGSRPADVAVDDDSVWVANRADATVSRINGFARRVIATVEVPPAPRALATGHGFVWVASPDSGSVTRLDAADPGTGARSIALGGRPSDVAVGEDAVWVVDPERATLTEIDPSSAKPAGPPLKLGEAPGAVAVGLGAVWVADAATSTVFEIDPENGEIREEHRVGKGPVALAIGDDSVWVANRRGQTLTRISPRAG
jgi:DNA-binding beta-propeller fold protein YncE